MTLCTDTGSTQNWIRPHSIPLALNNYRIAHILGSDQRIPTILLVRYIYMYMDTHKNRLSDIRCLGVDLADHGEHTIDLKVTYAYGQCFSI